MTRRLFAFAVALETGNQELFALLVWVDCMLPYVTPHRIPVNIPNIPTPLLVSYPATLLFFFGVFFSLKFWPDWSESSVFPDQNESKMSKSEALQICRRHQHYRMHFRQPSRDDTSCDLTYPIQESLNHREPVWEYNTFIFVGTQISILITLDQNAINIFSKTQKTEEV